MMAPGKRTHPRIMRDPRTIARATGLPLADVLDELARREMLEDRRPALTAETLPRLTSDDFAPGADAYDRAGDR